MMARLLLAGPVRRLRCLPPPPSPPTSWRSLRRCSAAAGVAAPRPPSYFPSLLASRRSDHKRLEKVGMEEREGDRERERGRARGDEFLDGFVRKNIYHAHPDPRARRLLLLLLLLFVSQRICEVWRIFVGVVLWPQATTSDETSQIPEIINTLI